MKAAFAFVSLLALLASASATCFCGVLDEWCNIFKCSGTGSPPTIPGPSGGCPYTFTPKTKINKHVSALTSVGCRTFDLDDSYSLVNNLAATCNRDASCAAFTITYPNWRYAKLEVCFYKSGYKTESDWDLYDTRCMGLYVKCDPPKHSPPPPIRHNPPPVVHNPPPIRHNPPPVIHNPPPVIHNPPPVIHNPPPVIHNPPPVVHSPPPATTEPSCCDTAHPKDKYPGAHQKCRDCQDTVHSYEGLTKADCCTCAVKTYRTKHSPAPEPLSDTSAVHCIDCLITSGAAYRHKCPLCARCYYDDGKDGLPRCFACVKRTIDKEQAMLFKTPFFPYSGYPDSSESSAYKAIKDRTDNCCYSCRMKLEDWSNPHDPKVVSWDPLWPGMDTPSQCSDCVKDNGFMHFTQVPGNANGQCPSGGGRRSLA